MRMPTRSLRFASCLALAFAAGCGQGGVATPPSPGAAESALSSGWYPINYALPGNGATVSATSVLSGNFPVANATDGNLADQWSGANNINVTPDTLQVSFGQYRTIDEIDVYTTPNPLSAPYTATTPIHPTYGLTGFSVDWGYFDYVRFRIVWTNIATVVGNTLAWRKFTFAPINAQYIRVVGTASPDGYARVNELQAWEASCSSCTATSTCNTTCRMGTGQQSTCGAANVCDRGTCASYCGSITVRSCSAACTAGGGLATTCGAMNYPCIGAVNGGAGTPFVCSSCSDAVPCNLACNTQDANATTSTCGEIGACIPVVPHVATTFANIVSSSANEYAFNDSTNGGFRSTTAAMSKA